MSIRVSVNGREVEVPEGATVASLLAQREVAQDQVTVAVNQQIVDRTQYDTIRLKPGDALELLYFIAGGRRGRQAA